MPEFQAWTPNGVIGCSDVEAVLNSHELKHIRGLKRRVIAAFSFGDKEPAVISMHWCWPAVAFLPQCSLALHEDHTQNPECLLDMDCIVVVLCGREKF